MRDLLVTAIVLITLPFILKRPSIGVILWVWLSVMNPHRLAWGFAYDLPFAAIVAGVTFVGLAITHDKRRLPITPATITLALFMLWMCLTSLFPYHSGTGYEMWSRVMKILLMTFVALTVLNTRQHLQWLVWILVFSLGFFGVKGGIFTLLNGGNYLVWGPPSSFIEGNNEVALALVMIVPLMRYLQLQLTRPWQRWTMSAAMLLCVLASLGSHSRGAMLAVVAMAVFLWWKSRNKIGMGIVLIAFGLVLVAFMPEEWLTRMNTIKTYEDDTSAMGRINAWYMAFNLATDRFLGGGFDIYDYEIFGRYAPDPLDVHAAHSIYFQVLGEHGFVGLALFLALGWFTWRAATDAKRRARKRRDAQWVMTLSDMIKVSLVGYAVGGAFLSLAYFDLPYYLLVLAVASREWVKALPVESPVTAPGMRRAMSEGGLVSARVRLDAPAMRPPPANPMAAGGRFEKR